MSLPKAHRLRQRHEFSAVYQSGLRRSTPHLTLRGVRSLKNKASDQSLQPLPPTRIGISISQKVSKRAVVRNRIKRQLHAAFRQLLPEMTLGWRLVVVVKPNATECDYEQFLQELKQLLISAEVIHGHSGRGLL